MKTTQIKIESKKYRLIAEEDYQAILQDIKDLKKVLQRRREPGIEARQFFKGIEGKAKPTRYKSI
jgi:hypothetical protein